jgi:hypothetical protein
MTPVPNLIEMIVKKEQGGLTLPERETEKL